METESIRSSIVTTSSQSNDNELINTNDNELINSHDSILDDSNVESSISNDTNENALINGSTDTNENAFFNTDSTFITNTASFTSTIDSNLDIPTFPDVEDNELVDLITPPLVDNRIFNKPKRKSIGIPMPVNSCII